MPGRLWGEIFLRGGAGMHFYKNVSPDCSSLLSACIAPFFSPWASLLLLNGPNGSTSGWLGARLVDISVSKGLVMYVCRRDCDLNVDLVKLMK